MKKLFFLALTMLVSVGVWAVDPDLVTAELSSNDAITALAKEYSDVGITISTGLTKGSAINSHYPVTFGNSLGWSDNEFTYYFRIAAQQQIDSVAFFWCPNGTNNTNIAWCGWADGVTPQLEVGNCWGLLPVVKSSKNYSSAIWQTLDLTATDTAVYTLQISRQLKGLKNGGTNIGNQGESQTFHLFQVKVWLAPTCTDPEFTVSPTEGTGFVGDPIDIAVTSKNQSKPINPVVTVDGVPGVYGTDYTFSASTGLVQATPLKAGKFEITFSQASNDTYCAAEESATFVISEKTPVTTVSIDGPATGFVGQELTYTATAEGATAYQWLVDGIDANTNAATFKYTAVKGNHSIVCKARNQFNVQNEEETWVESDPIELTVTKVCGTLIKLNYSDMKANTSSSPATITLAASESHGVVGGTAYQKTRNGAENDGYRLSSNDMYFGLKLASGTFMAGDTLIVNIVAAGVGVLSLYSALDGDSLQRVSYGTATGIQKFVLNNKFTGKNSIYIYRKADSSEGNATFSAISVTRSCEDSDDASVKSLTVNGEEVAKDAEANKFEYTVSSSYVEENVTVAFTIHPLATSDKENNTFTIPTPEAGDTNGASFKVTAEDGTPVTYTVFISKSASLSNDATLKALSVEGFTLAPAFDPAVVEYTITKAYSAALPDASKVTATANDANATVNVAYNELVENEILVQVLAEDGETANTYSIKVLSAAAKKDLLEASFSNGANGYIKDGNIKVPYLYGTEEPTFVAAKFWNAEGEPSAAVVDGQLVVTGADASTDTYTIEFIAVTPMEASYDLITFTEVPSYIYSIYGWDESKGIKFSKDVEEASKKRISEGQDRIYIALPAAESVILTGGSTGARPIKVTVNGVVDEKVTSTPKTGETITISLSKSTANFIGIESNGSNGDAGFTKMQLVKGTSTALGNTDAAVQTVKVIRNGQLIIIRDGKEFNVLGTAVK